MPATLTTASSRTATTVAASSRGSTRRWSGLTPITSMALISSRMRRDPRSAHMADPPAPAMRSAVATGACSRTTASTMAAPSCDWAPICWSSDPTSSAMTMPKGIDNKMSGSVVTRARNQHWSKNSATGRPLSGSLAQGLERGGEHVARLAHGVANFPSSLRGRLGRGSTRGRHRPPARRAEAARHFGPGEGCGRDPAARAGREVVQSPGSANSPPFRGLLMDAAGPAPLPRPLPFGRKNGRPARTLRLPCLAGSVRTTIPRNVSPAGARSSWFATARRFPAAPNECWS